MQAAFATNADAWQGHNIVIAEIKFAALIKKYSI